MKEGQKCMKVGCNVDLTGNGVISVRFPVFFEGNWLEFYLCRDHFIMADDMGSSEFRKWVHEKDKKGVVKNE